MSPRAKRSESVTLPPGNHPCLIRYEDEKGLITGTPSEESDNVNEDVSIHYHSERSERDETAPVSRVTKGVPVEDSSSDVDESDLGSDDGDSAGGSNYNSMASSVVLNDMEDGAESSVTTNDYVMVLETSRR